MYSQFHFSMSHHGAHTVIAKKIHSPCGTSSAYDEGSYLPPYSPQRFENKYKNRVVVKKCQASGASRTAGGPIYENSSTTSRPVSLAHPKSVFGDPRSHDLGISRACAVAAGSYRKPGGLACHPDHAQQAYPSENRENIYGLYSSYKYSNERKNNNGGMLILNHNHGDDFNYNQKKAHHAPKQQGSQMPVKNLHDLKMETSRLKPGSFISSEMKDNPDEPNKIETYFGTVDTVRDVLLLVEACRINLLPRMKRRLSDKNRKLIKPGSVFVWMENEAGIKRWTDGKSWSPSRVYGSFLVYRECFPKAKLVEFGMQMLAGAARDLSSSPPPPLAAPHKDRTGIPATMCCGGGYYADCELPKQAVGKRGASLRRNSEHSSSSHGDGDFQKTTPYAFEKGAFCKSLLFKNAFAFQTALKIGVGKSTTPKEKYGFVARGGSGGISGIGGGSIEAAGADNNNEEDDNDNDNEIDNEIDNDNDNNNEEDDNDNDNDNDRSLFGIETPLIKRGHRGEYCLTPNGLYKKTISVSTSTGLKFHVVHYYEEEEDEEEEEANAAVHVGAPNSFGTSSFREIANGIISPCAGNPPRHVGIRHGSSVYNPALERGEDEAACRASRPETRSRYGSDTLAMRSRTPQEHRRSPYYDATRQGRQAEGSASIRGDEKTAASGCVHKGGHRNPIPTTSGMNGVTKRLLSPSSDDFFKQVDLPDIYPEIESHNTLRRLASQDGTAVGNGSGDVNLNPHYYNGADVSLLDCLRSPPANPQPKKATHPTTTTAHTALDSSFAGWRGGGGLQKTLECEPRAEQFSRDWQATGYKKKTAVEFPITPNGEDEPSYDERRNQTSGTFNSGGPYKEKHIYPRSTATTVASGNGSSQTLASATRIPSLDGELYEQADENPRYLYSPTLSAASGSFSYNEITDISTTQEVACKALIEMQYALDIDFETGDRSGTTTKSTSSRRLLLSKPRIILPPIKVAPHAALGYEKRDFGAHEHDALAASAPLSQCRLANYTCGSILGHESPSNTFAGNAAQEAAFDEPSEDGPAGETTATNRRRRRRRRRSFSYSWNSSPQNNNYANAMSPADTEFEIQNSERLELPPIKWRSAQTDETSISNFSSAEALMNTRNFYSGNNFITARDEENGDGKCDGDVRKDRKEKLRSSAGTFTQAVDITRVSDQRKRKTSQCFLGKIISSKRTFSDSEDDSGYETFEHPEKMERK